MAVPAPAVAPVYRKLTRMRSGLGTRTQLWLGPDHLLHVNSTGYTESYRRFYLRDIQSLLIVHTALRTYVAVAFAALLLIVFLIVRSAGGGLVGYAITGGLFLPFFLWNHLLGAGCRVVIITAVQQENVRALSRLPKTRRVLAELRPLIEAAQADLSASAPVVAATPGTTPPMPPPLPPPL
jgi:hypothetical protein